MEETHYYPFGLTMSGIFSKAAGSLINKEKTFQDQRFDDDLGLNLVQFKWRNHDPQIGRFIEIDPLSEKYLYNSPYAFSENKVTAHIELEGLEAVEIGVRLVVSLWEYMKGGGETMTHGAAEEKKHENGEYDYLPPQAQAVKKTVATVEKAAGFAQAVHVPLEVGVSGASMVLGSGEIRVAQSVVTGTPQLKNAASYLYRAVSNPELVDATANGIRNIPNTSSYQEGKLFATTASDAAEYGRNNFLLDGQPNTILKVAVSKDVMKTATTETMDGMKAVMIPTEHLSKIKVLAPMTSTPKPTNPFNWTSRW